jgi:hypothetical protein
MAKPGFIAKVGMFLLFATLYLESLPFSFETVIGRVRPNTIVILILAYLMLLSYLVGRSKVKIPKPLFFLAIYIVTNIISLLKSENLGMSLRIVFLLISWFLISVYLVNYCSSEKVALKMVKWFLFFGIIQGLLGMGQVLGEFERPTATMGSGDSDYFGLIMMGNLLVLSTLQILKVRVFGKRSDYLIAILFIINLYFSFVRSAWLGYLAGFAFLVLFTLFHRLRRYSVPKKNVLIVACVAALIFYTAFSLTSNLQEYFTTRLSLSATGNYSIKENIRFKMMAHSWNNAMASPIIGNGPAAFTTQGTALNIKYGRGIAFDPSIVTTLMNDTGILGAFTFILFLWVFFSDVFRTFRYNPQSILAKYAVAFSIGVFGLLISYVFTNGLWLPFSWVFFGLTTALAAAARKQNIHEGYVASK